MAEFDQRRNFEAYGGQQVNNVGPDIVSATTIAPTHRIHRVSGANPIETITPPWAGFSGDLVLIPTGAFTWTAAGNILLTGTAVVSRPLHLTYNPVVSKWAAHAIA